MAGGIKNSDQSGSFNKNTDYTKAGNSANVAAGVTDTTQQQQQRGSYENGVVAPAGWEDAWRNSAAVPAGYFNNMMDRSSYTTAMLEKNYPDLYKPIQDVKAGTVDARTGASFMDNYTQPWNAVKDAALADYGLTADKAIGAFKGANAPFAGNNRTAFGQNDLAKQIATGAGNLSANILGQGFTTAAGLGQQDASRAAQVQTANADRTLNADQFNNNFNFNRELTDAGLAYQGDQMRDNAALNLSNINNNYLKTGQALFGQKGTTSNDSFLQNIQNMFGINLGASNEQGHETSSGTTQNNTTDKGGGFDFTKGLDKLMGA